MLEGSREVMENLRFVECGMASMNAPLLVLPESDMDRSMGDVVARLGELVEGIHLISSMFLLCALVVCNNYTISFPQVYCSLFCIFL